MRTKKSKRIQRKVLSAVGILLCVIFGFFLICNLTIIVKGYLNPDAPPSVFNLTPLATLTGSMSGDQEGHIEIGDLILIGKAEPEELKAGDVISYMEGSVIVTHRIQEVQTAEAGGIQWITKGDANNAADPQPVPESALVGIVVGRIPKLGSFAMFMQQPLGMVIFIGVPALCFILWDSYQRRRYAKRQQAKQARMQEELIYLRELAAERAAVPAAETAAVELAAQVAEVAPNAEDRPVRRRRRSE